MLPRPTFCLECLQITFRQCLDNTGCPLGDVTLQETVAMCQQLTAWQFVQNFENDYTLLHRPFLIVGWPMSVGALGFDYDSLPCQPKGDILSKKGSLLNMEKIMFE